VPEGYSVGIKSRWTAGHVLRLHGLLVAARKSKPAKLELVESIRGCLHVFGASTHDSIFAFSDPMPAFIDLFYVAKYLSSYDAQALFRRFSRRS
jgi:hypothetical protein